MIPKLNLRSFAFEIDTFKSKLLRIWRYPEPQMVEILSMQCHLVLSYEVVKGSGK